MVAQPYRLLMSVDEYLALERSSSEERYEFIDGYAYMLAGGTADHSIIKQNIASLIRNQLRGSPCRVYDSDMKVRLSEKRYVYPDVSVTCDPRDRGRVDIVQSPRLIVEVLSPSTEAKDRGKKFSYYRACPTVEEYVLVDTQQKSIEVYQREQHPFWKLSPFGPGDEVVLTSLGISFPLASVYEDVIFLEDNSST
ncbi:MAG: Uma2 family endonuclease [Ktedonobacteraceae bacterium]|nr:Uma2 family endonuclease [Ktedonobacteraceae bacterium]